MLTLLAIVALQSNPYPLALPRGCRDRSCVRGRVVPNNNTTPLFEFAPLSGAGMGTACACTTPTGSKGEAMTFTRATSGTCLKTVGTAPQSIANGDMVTCTSGQPRVMPGTDGTSINGLLVEPARTNVVLRSESFDNAAWASFTAGAGAAPTKGSADTDVAPDGNTTAEQVTFKATGASDSSGLSQTVLTAAAYSQCLFARGNATTASGTFDICGDKASGAQCAACSFNSSGWTRCVNQNFTSKASGLWYVGNLSSLNGGTTRAQQTVTLWGAQGEAGAFCSSYIATTSASVTRNFDLADVAVSWPSGSPGFSEAATSSMPTGASVATRVAGSLFGGSLGGAPAIPYCDSYCFGGGDWFIECTPSSATYDTGKVCTQSTTFRVAQYHTGALISGCLNGACGAGTAATWTTPVAWTRIRLAAYDASNGPLGGVTKQICLDPSPSRCR